MSARRPVAPKLLAGLLVCQGLTGIGGGIVLLLDPTGEVMGLSLALLEGSPFPDYLIPGAVLLSVLGFAPLVVARGVWGGRPWGWMAALGVGVALLVWIAVQVLVVGYQPRPPLQVVYGALGLVLAALSLLPSVRRHGHRPGRLRARPS